MSTAPEQNSEAMKIAENLAKTRLAHEAMMLADAQATLKSDRNVVRSHHKNTLGDTFMDEESDDAIHIGDSVVNQYVTPQQPQPQVQAQQASFVTKQLSPLVLGLLIGGTGLGSAIVGAAINYYLSTPHQIIDIGTPQQGYGLDFYKPDEQ